MTLKDVVLEALDRVSEEEIGEIIKALSGNVPTKAADEDAAAEKLEQRRKKDRDRQARYRASKADKETKEAEDQTEEEAEEDFAAKYEDKTAPQLFQLCKARKMKTVEPKRKQRYYIDMLVELDKKEAAEKAKQEAEEAETEDLDWGDEEEEEKPAKKDPKPARGRGKKKPDPEPETDEDEGEWDI